MDKSLAEKLKGAPASVQNCAANVNDHVFYERGACSLGRGGRCPFISQKAYIQLNGEQLPVCKRYHPKYSTLRRI